MPDHEEKKQAAYIYINNVPRPQGSFNDSIMVQMQPLFANKGLSRVVSFVNVDVPQFEVRTFVKLLLI
jgi:hypothetical protein